MSDLPLASSAVEAPALAQLAARIHEAVREADLAGADPFAKVKGPKPKGWTHTHTGHTDHAGAAKGHHGFVSSVDL